MHEKFRFQVQDCEENRPVRVYTHVDSRYILEDFFAKLAICYGE